MHKSVKFKLLYQNLILAALVLPPGTAVAQSAGAGMAVEEFVVTGTRRVDRSAIESTAPVDVFTADVIAAQPTGDMVDALRNLVPSLSVGRNSIRDGSAFIRQPNLRGLAPDETLVLVNGKRFHKSALVSLNANALFAASQGVDLNQIPSSAVGRIDVLRDGASAQYGSDAIAGVINYGLKTNSEGFTGDGRVGQYIEGDGDEFQLQGNLGLPLGRGFFNISADYLKADETARGTQRPNAVVLSALGYNVEKPTQKYGNPNVESYHVFVNSAVPVSDNVELYAFGNYGASKQNSSFFFRTPIDVNVPVPAGSGLTSFFGKSVATTYLDRITAPDPRPGANFGVPTQFWNANGRTWEVSNIYPNGFTPQLYGDLEDYSTYGGARGEFFGINYDLSGSYGYNSIAYVLDKTVNPSLGPDTPTRHYIGKLIQQENNLNADFTYGWDIGLASPLNIAVGGEMRDENYQIHQGETSSWISGQYAVQQVFNPTTNRVTLVTHGVGANGLPGYGPDAVTDESRQSYAAYIDLEADITPDLTIGLAGRYEHFSDFGATQNGKISARYAFTPEIAVRGAVSTGFKAPTPGQLFTRNVSTAFQVGTGVPYELALLRATDPAARFYGAVPMKPEKSFNISAGLVLTPTSDLNITLDYFNIKVSDRIGITGQIPVLDSDRDQLRVLGVSNYATIGQVRYFTNGFSTRTQGVDLVATHELPTDVGNFSTQVSANYTDTRILNRQDTITPDGRRFVLIDDVGKGNIENLIPKVKGNITETWSIDKWMVTGRVRFFGNFTHYSLINNVVTPKTFAEQGLFDLAVNYDVTDNVRLTVGGENILDSYPERETRGVYPITNSTANGSIYLDDSPAGFNGAFLYAKVGLKF